MVHSIGVKRPNGKCAVSAGCVQLATDNKVQVHVYVTIVRYLHGAFVYYLSHISLLKKTQGEIYH